MVSFIAEMTAARVHFLCWQLDFQPNSFKTLMSQKTDCIFLLKVIQCQDRSYIGRPNLGA